MSEEDLEYHVDMLRASISLLEAGRYVTYPYEVAMARDLYKSLFSPIEAELANVDHLIFEPDGAMLRLPIDILVADDASVRAYQARVSAPGGDVFDFSGVNWMARGRRISTAVSAQTFVDARKVERSRAAQQYLGMGSNAPIGSAPSPEIRAVIADLGLLAQATYVERASLPDQVVCPLAEAPDAAPYFSMILLTKGADPWL